MKYSERSTMKFTRSGWQILACMGLCAMGAALCNDTPARAAEPAAPTSAPSTAPATQVASPQDREFIVQLGADDFKARDAAADQLRKRGKDALPALKEGIDSKDPEVKTRCLALIKEWEDKEKAIADAKKNGPIEDLVINGQVVGNIRIGVNGGNNVNFTNIVKMGPTGSMQTVMRNNMIFSMLTDVNSLLITVNMGGQVKTYKANDLDDLKKTDPEGYKIYQQIFEPLKGKLNAAGAAAGPAQNQGQVIRVPPVAPNAALQPMPPQPAQPQPQPQPQAGPSTTQP